MKLYKLNLVRLKEFWILDFPAERYANGYAQSNDFEFWTFLRNATRTATLSRTILDSAFAASDA
ncbi:hypothetical protein [Nostoc sp. JL33]|uniref:hypothetical protein n=1 Tax=Nostoc sp. JL33 TaxID=2815396 RepID=UPI0025E55704|nr:hypothetical protein [Nostoc sp. JL33]MBN3871087.1 hypothetical protein [Nostoc sp. JL33]